jgi:small subunit ribosomal protein S20
LPKLKSSKKRLRTNLKARLKNKAIRTRMRTAIKSVRVAEDKETATGALQTAISLIDKTAQKKVIHPNMAARYKSNLTRMVQKMD